MPTTPKISDANIEHSADSGDDADALAVHPTEPEHNTGLEHNAGAEHRAEAERHAGPDSAPHAGAPSGSPVVRQDRSIPTMLPAGVLLDQLPDGAALLNHEFRILWCNRQLREFTAQSESERIKPAQSESERNKSTTNRAEDALIGKSFYEAFGAPEIIGPDFCPLHTALGSGELAKSSLRVGEKTYYEVQARPVVPDGGDAPNLLVVSVRDISAEVLQRQKLNAIYQAGLELGDLSLQDILQMSVDDRIDLLKSKILHYTQDLLQFGTVEIRLLDKRTRTLEPLLAVGMDPGAASRALRADPQGNGVTGFVAATGKSYLCEDTQTDPLYLPGAPGARSSLTVPLILHDEILGTFNVESPKPGAFNENDLQFLELFSREVAVAINTFELLAVEKMTTASASTDRILREVASPVDEILNDAACILERYIGHEPIVSERLQRILKHTRNIKQLIQKVGETFAPLPSHAPLMPRQQRPLLRGKRILVVDADETVRIAAHELLGRFGCEVETAHNAEDAFVMVRSFHYDAVLADIRLPDMTGFDCFYQIKQIHEHLPVILMTGFGYDPAHSIVKARQHGLKSVLYKPFRLEQLLTEVEKAVSSPADGACSN
ncbi:MAG TPA: response regulator [Planctomycetaceae bacterium]|nr:response regulator [Planctomycetaceae bacterium]